MGKLTECKNEVAGSNITLLNVLCSLNRIITHRANTLLSTHHQYLSTITESWETMVDFLRLNLREKFKMSRDILYKCLVMS